MTRYEIPPLLYLKQNKKKKGMCMRYVYVFLCVFLIGSEGFAQNYTDSLRSYEIYLFRSNEHQEIVSTLGYLPVFSVGNEKDTNEIFINGFFFEEKKGSVSISDGINSIMLSKHDGGDSIIEKIFVAAIKQTVQIAGNGDMNDFISRLFELCHRAPVVFLSGGEELHLQLRPHEVGNTSPSLSQYPSVEYFDLSGRRIFDLSSVPQGIYLEVSGKNVKKIFIN